MFPSSLTYQHLVLCWVGVCVTWKTSMTVRNQSMTPPPPGVVKWSAMDFQRGVLTQVFVYVCMAWAPSCHESWAAGSTPKYENVPLISVSGQWDSPTVEMWVLCPRITSRGRKWANCSACRASEGEKRILVCVNPKGSKSLKNVDVILPWDSEDNIYLPDLAKQRKNPTSMQPWDIGICCLLCYCSISVCQQHWHTTKSLFPNKLNRKLVFKETNIFQVSSLRGTFWLVCSPMMTQSGTCHIFLTQDFPSGLV